jgi:tetratricopeptide (TPR) repeat protein
MLMPETAKAVFSITKANMTRHYRIITRPSGLDPGNSYYWSGKGNALNLGRKDEAIQAYNKVIELNPNNVPAWYNKGRTQNILGRTTEADEAQAKVKELGYTG